MSRATAPCRRTGRPAPSSSTPPSPSTSTSSRHRRSTCYFLGTGSGRVTSSPRGHRLRSALQGVVSARDEGHADGRPQGGRVDPPLVAGRLPGARQQAHAVRGVDLHARPQRQPVDLCLLQSGPHASPLHHRAGAGEELTGRHRLQRELQGVVPVQDEGRADGDPCRRLEDRQLERRLPRTGQQAQPLQRQGVHAGHGRGEDGEHLVRQAAQARSRREAGSAAARLRLRRRSRRSASSSASPGTDASSARRRGHSRSTVARADSVAPTSSPPERVQPAGDPVAGLRLHTLGRRVHGADEDLRDHGGVDEARHGALRRQSAGTSVEVTLESPSFACGG